MTNEQIQAAMSQLMAQGHSQEAAVAAIQAHMAKEQAALVQQAPVQQEPTQQFAQPTQVAQAVQQNVVQQTVGIDNILALASMAGAADDHSIVRTGFAPAAAGQCTIRLRGYIEVGVHKPSNPTHKNREMVHLIMEVNSPQHLITEENVVKPREIVIRTPKAHSGNAGFPRLFNALNAAHGNKYHHIGEMLGQAWCAEIFHSKPDANGRIWENFDNDKVWSFAGTSGMNRDGSQYQVDVPPLVGAPLFFVYENSGVTDPQHIKQLWDTIYVGGVRESQKADGTTVQSSKNYYQELIRANLTWNESKTKAALMTQCDPATLEPIAPKQRAGDANAQPTQVPQIGAQVAPVTPVLAPTNQAVNTVMPQVQMPIQEQPQPQVALAANQPQVMPNQNVVSAPVQNTVVSVPNNEPQVVVPSATFTAPPTLQEQVQAQPTVITQPQVAMPQQANAATDPNAFLAQFAQ